MKKIVPIIIIALIALALAMYFFVIKPKKEAAPIKLYGNVEIHEAEAAFRQSGRIRELFFDEGDKVEAGQILAELDTDTFNDAIASANAEISAVTSELNKLKNGSRAEEIALADANMRQAKAMMENAQREYERQAALVPSGAVAQKVADNLKSQYEIAKANFDAANEALKLRKSGVRKEDIQTGESKLEAAQAQKQKLLTALDDTKLIAPVSGIIIARTKEKGGIITPNLAVYTISIQKPVYVRAYVPETQLGNFAPGTKVLINNDSSKTQYQGQVGFVSPRSEFTPKTVETQDLRSDLVYRLRINIAQSDGKLLQGMPVTVQLANQNQNSPAAK
jgi:HlyD family secretion protein